MGKIEDSLDIRELIRDQRAFKTLRSLTLTKLSRQLVHLQRSTTVLDLRKRSNRKKKNEFGELGSTSSDYSGIDSDKES